MIALSYADTRAELGMSEEVATLGLSLYVLGMGFFPRELYPRFHSSLYRSMRAQAVGVADTTTLLSAVLLGPLSEVSLTFKPLSNCASLTTCNTVLRPTTHLQHQLLPLPRLGELSPRWRLALLAPGAPTDSSQTSHRTSPSPSHSPFSLHLPPLTRSRRL